MHGELKQLPQARFFWLIQKANYKKIRPSVKQADPDRKSELNSGEFFGETP